ncbi:cytochrome c [Corallincola platygyrae]|uniref:Cytochrome c n=1 Tax=Corallincola platygyrae TaxID=1193278 RepID=A0ABW4XPR4_9GAMM
MFKRLFPIFTATLAATVPLLFTSAAQADDIAEGKAKAQSCAACHGKEGISSIPMYPNLAGQKQMYFEMQMKAFRDGSRPNPIMANFAKPLTDEDIRQIAAYYASLKH